VGGWLNGDWSGGGWAEAVKVSPNDITSPKEHHGIRGRPNRNGMNWFPLTFRFEPGSARALSLPRVSKEDRPAGGSVFNEFAGYADKSAWYLPSCRVLASFRAAVSPIGLTALKNTLRDMASFLLVWTVGER
jgi:hypothetical protein